MLHHSALIPADKPPIEELHQFLEFQLPRQWAPVFSELPLGPQRKQRSSASLQFSFMGPKLYVNTIQVIVCNSWSWTSRYSLAMPLPIIRNYVNALWLVIYYEAQTWTFGHQNLNFVGHRHHMHTLEILGKRFSIHNMT